MMWWIAAAMLVVALAIIVYPLWRSREQVTLDSNTANVALLKDQLQELEQEFANGNISEEHYDRARMELEASVAADLVEDANEVARPLSLKTRRLLGLTLVVAIPLSTVAMYREISTHQPMPPRQQVAEQAGTAEMARREMPSIDEMVERLADKLRREPDNIEGWLMLGKSYMVLERIPEAANAYGKAYELAGDINADLLADYAEVLAYANNDDMSGKPMELVNKALQLDPMNAKALWLAGFAAMQANDRATAIQYWQRLLDVPDLTPDTREVTMRYITMARGLPVQPAEQAMAAEESATDTVVDSTADKVAVEVKVTLDESFRNRVTSEETVYVFARPSQGMPMPLAVKRITVADLPTTVVLDDSMAMLKGNNLSSHSEVVVGARVSRAGTPMPQPGDLEGVGGVINPRETSQQSIVINQVVN